MCLAFPLLFCLPPLPPFISLSLPPYTPPTPLIMTEPEPPPPRPAQSLRALLCASTSHSTRLKVFHKMLQLLQLVHETAGTHGVEPATATATATAALACGGGGHTPATALAAAAKASSSRSATPQDTPPPRHLPTLHLSLSGRGPHA